MIKTLFRDVHLGDINALLDLDQRCLGGMWTAQSYQREIENTCSHWVILSLAETDQVLGSGAFWAVLEEAHITLLMIDPDYQGQGFGKQLLQALLKKAITLQLERATLEVNVNNIQAIALYQKAGFQVAGRRKGYYQETGEDALILWQNHLGNQKIIKTF